MLAATANDRQIVQLLKRFRHGLVDPASTTGVVALTALATIATSAGLNVITGLLDSDAGVGTSIIRLIGAMLLLGGGIYLWMILPERDSVKYSALKKRPSLTEDSEGLRDEIFEIIDDNENHKYKSRLDRRLIVGVALIMAALVPICFLAWREAAIPDAKGEVQQLVDLVGTVSERIDAMESEIDSRGEQTEQIGRLLDRMEECVNCIDEDLGRLGADVGQEPEEVDGDPEIVAGSLQDDAAGTATEAEEKIEERSNPLGGGAP